jgi:phage/plasmid-like protein (TIGR03299 family)
MSDAVEEMFSVRDVPWHKALTGDRTHVLDEYPQSWADARVLAGLDWDPEWALTYEKIVGDDALRSLFAQTLANTGIGRDAQLDQLMTVYNASLKVDQSHSRIARSDTKATLSYQRPDTYTLIKNSEFGEIIDAILEAGETNGQQMVSLETGGCLSEGCQVWMLVRINEPIRVPGDKSVAYPYLAITSRHDGKAACCARLTTVRIRCRNTFDLADAEGEQTGAVFSFSHRGADWRERIEDARLALGFARDERKRWETAMTQLTGIRFTEETRTMWLREFIPAPPDGIISDRTARNIEEARQAVLGILNGPTIAGAGVDPFSGYACVEAAGEYLDHVRKANNWVTRTKRMLLAPDAEKAKAVRLVRELASV